MPALTEFISTYLLHGMYPLHLTGSNDTAPPKSCPSVSLVDSHAESDVQPSLIRWPTPRHALQDPRRDNRHRKERQHSDYVHDE